MVSQHQPLRSHTQYCLGHHEAAESPEPPEATKVEEGVSAVMEEESEGKSAVMEEDSVSESESDDVTNIVTNNF